MTRPTIAIFSTPLRVSRSSLAAGRQPRLAFWYSTRYSQPATRASRGGGASAFSPGEDVLNFDHVAAGETKTQAIKDPYLKDKEQEWEQKRQHHLRRLRFASYGLFASVLATAAVAYKLIGAIDEEEQRRRSLQADAPPDANAKFLGRPVQVIGAGEDKRIITEGEEHVELVETGTSSVPFFPRVLHLPVTSDKAASAPNSALAPRDPLNDEEYTLVGLGIRTVSIFSIQVYVLGLYVRTSDLSELQAQLIHHVNPAASTLVPNEKSDLQTALLDPSKSQEIWNALLTAPIRSAWRVVPTRNTDFNHLRDGWLTGIRRGTQAAAAALAASPPTTTTSSGPPVSEYEGESFGTAVREFQRLFDGRGRAPKGSVVTLRRRGGGVQGALDVFFEDPAATDGQGIQHLGTAADPRIARLIWLGYTAGKNVSSEAVRKGVAEGCLTLASRPVGSAETMVT